MQIFLWITGHSSGFCKVSTGLSRSVLDIRVKRGADLSSDHLLVVCNLDLEKPTGFIEKYAGPASPTE